MENLKKEADKEVVSIDPVIFSLINNELHILLLKRRDDEEPYSGTWMLPGGSIKQDLDLSLEQSVERVLENKTGVKANYIEQLMSIGGHIDPRGWTLSVSYIALVSAQKTNENAKWVKISELNEYYLGFKHHETIIENAIMRLTNKVNYSTLPIYLLEENFTLPQLQSVYEVLLNDKLDKSTFRKKIQETNLLFETGEMVSGGAYRPAKLYSIKKQKVFHFGKNILK